MTEKKYIYTAHGQTKFKGQSLQQKEKKRGKTKNERNFKKLYKSLTWKDVGHFIFLTLNFDFFA